jgi:hypothetical protein
VYCSIVSLEPISDRTPDSRTLRKSLSSFSFNYFYLTLAFVWVEIDQQSAIVASGRAVFVSQTFEPFPIVRNDPRQVARIFGAVQRIFEKQNSFIH